MFLNFATFDKVAFDVINDSRIRTASIQFKFNKLVLSLRTLKISFFSWGIYRANALFLRHGNLWSLMQVGNLFGPIPWKWRPKPSNLFHILCKFRKKNIHFYDQKEKIPENCFHNDFIDKAINFYGRGASLKQEMIKKVKLKKLFKFVDNLLFFCRISFKLCKKGSFFIIVCNFKKEQWNGIP